MNTNPGGVPIIIIFLNFIYLFIIIIFFSP